MKRVLSLILCFSTSFSLIVPSHAAASMSDQPRTDTATVYLSDEVSLNISITDQITRTVLPHLLKSHSSIMVDWLERLCSPTMESIYLEQNIAMEPL